MANIALTTEHAPQHMGYTKFLGLFIRELIKVLRSTEIKTHNEIPVSRSKEKTQINFNV